MQPEPAFDLLLTDVVMPDGLDGLELARLVRAKLPALPIILLTGHDDALPKEDAFRILRKPLPVEQLAQALGSALRPDARLVSEAAAERPSA
jgi:CheY-like chemotaxis protein